MKIICRLCDEEYARCNCSDKHQRYFMKNLELYGKEQDTNMIELFNWTILIAGTIVAIIYFIYFIYKY